MEDTNLREITLTLVSADSLPDVRIFGRMKVYAIVCINGYDDTVEMSPIDTDGERNPKWNFSIKYNVPESWLMDPEMEFMVYLYCQRSFGSDTFMGHVIIPFKSLFDQQGLDVNASTSFPVHGTPEGKLNILGKIGERVSAPEAQTAPEAETAPEAHETAPKAQTTAHESRSRSVLKTIAKGALNTGVKVFLGVDIGLTE